MCYTSASLDVRRALEILVIRKAVCGCLQRALIYEDAVRHVPFWGTAPQGG
jgi:hypothetical protein